MGYLSIDRKLFNHFLWEENRVYSKFEAWLDLIQLVSYKKQNKALINGVFVTWTRGQYPVSYSFLMKRWGWSANRVRGYLSMLKNHKQIDTETTSVCTLITLCNYEQYNREPQAEGIAEGIADDTSDGTADGRAMEGIKIKENKENQGESRKEDITPPKPQKRVSVKEAPKQNLVDWIVSEFTRHYYDTFGMQYSVANKGKERAAAAKLIRHYQSQYPEGNTQDAKEKFSHWFPLVMVIDDSFIQDNMGLPTIASKFNEINKVLRNGKYKRNNGKGAAPASREDLHRVAEKYFPVTGAV